MDYTIQTPDYDIGSGRDDETKRELIEEGHGYRDYKTQFGGIVRVITPTEPWFQKMEVEKAPLKRIVAEVDWDEADQFDAKAWSNCDEIYSPRTHGHFTIMSLAEYAEVFSDVEKLWLVKQCHDRTRITVDDYLSGEFYNYRAAYHYSRFGALMENLEVKVELDELIEEASCMGDNERAESLISMPLAQCENHEFTYDLQADPTYCISRQEVIMEIDYGKDIPQEAPADYISTCIGVDSHESLRHMGHSELPPLLFPKPQDPNRKGPSMEDRMCFYNNANQSTHYGFLPEGYRDRSMEQYAISLSKKLDTPVVYFTKNGHSYLEVSIPIGPDMVKVRLPVLGVSMAMIRYLSSPNFPFIVVPPDIMKESVRYILDDRYVFRYKDAKHFQSSDRTIIHPRCSCSLGCRRHGFDLSYYSRTNSRPVRGSFGTVGLNNPEVLFVQPKIQQHVGMMYKPFQFNTSPIVVDQSKPYAVRRDSSPHATLAFWPSLQVSMGYVAWQRSNRYIHFSVSEFMSFVIIHVDGSYGEWTGIPWSLWLRLVSLVPERPIAASILFFWWSFEKILVYEK